MIRRHFVTIAVILMLAAVAMPASAKPDFSGSWVVVPDKSDFGPMPPPEKDEQTVTHKDPDLTVVVSQTGLQGEVKYEIAFNTEGKETTSEIRGRSVKSTAKWDGDTLLMESKMDLQGNELKLVHKWALSSDGKTLTINSKITSPQGEFEMTRVMARQ